MLLAPRQARMPEAAQALALRRLRGGEAEIDVLPAVEQEGGDAGGRLHWQMRAGQQADMLRRWIPQGLAQQQQAGLDHAETAPGDAAALRLRRQPDAWRQSWQQGLPDRAGAGIEMQIAGSAIIAQAL
nr:hypothetical protein [Siccirubricoccus sp. G192]